MGLGSLWSSSPSTPTYTVPDATAGPSITAPIPHPKQGARLPPSHTLTDSQTAIVQALVATLSAPGYAIPSQLKDLKPFWKTRAKSDATSGTSTPSLSAVKMENTETSSASSDQGLHPLTDHERCWLTSEQIQRCCRAVKWDAKRALERIEETLVWRREFGTDRLTAKDVWTENETGKQYIYGYDKESRPLHYMHPDRQNTKVSPEQIRHVVYQLERTVDLMPPGVENLCLCIDFGASHGGGQPTTVGQARTVLHILQTYYCERLGRAICANVPAVFTAFYTIIKPFIDPVTKDKIRFVKDVSEVHSLVDEDFLTTTDFGASQNIYYNRHSEYFAALDELCKERREANFERWQKLCNSQIGASEFVVKGGVPAANGAAASASKEEEPVDEYPDEHEPTVITPPQIAADAKIAETSSTGVEEGVQALKV